MSGKTNILCIGIEVGQKQAFVAIAISLITVKEMVCT
jgi:hypothetical protein